MTVNGISIIHIHQNKQLSIYKLKIKMFYIHMAFLPLAFLPLCLWHFYLWQFYPHSISPTLKIFSQRIFKTLKHVKGRGYFARAGLGFPKRRTFLGASGEYTLWCKLRYTFTVLRDFYETSVLVQDISLAQVNFVIAL